MNGEVLTFDGQEIPGGLQNPKTIEPSVMLCMCMRMIGSVAEPSKGFPPLYVTSTSAVLDCKSICKYAVASAVEGFGGTCCEAFNVTVKQVGA